MTRTVHLPTTKSSYLYTGPPPKKKKKKKKKKKCSIQTVLPLSGTTKMNKQIIQNLILLVIGIGVLIGFVLLVGFSASFITGE